WPSSPERRLAAAAFWAVLLMPALIAPLAAVRLVSLWSMSAFTLLPVMLLSSPLVALTRRDAASVLTIAVAFPFVRVALAPSGADWCANTATARARCSPAGKQAEIELSRSYLGMEGKPARYLLITIAPRHSDTPGSELPADCQGVRAR